MLTRSKSAVFLALAMMAIFSLSAHASATDIAVGVYNFPPVASVNEEKEADGFLGDLFEELSREHESLSFQILHTSPQRRYIDFEAGLYDVIFFESPHWKWDKLDVDMSQALLKDEEVYVALKKPGRDQSFFDHIGERSIVAISGYHYGFAGFSTDNSELLEKFDIEFSHSHHRNLNLIKADRPSLAEVAIVSRAFLHTYWKNHPEDQGLFLVSDIADQSYELHIMARKNGPVSIKQIEQLLKPLIDSGRYQALVKRYGLELPDYLKAKPVN